MLRFVNVVTDLYVEKSSQVGFGSRRLKIRVIAWNGGRFDHIILLKTLVKISPSEIELFGTISNIKLLTIGGITFEDALRMT